MFSVRDFWRRHRRKISVSLAVAGSGYLLYKLYDSHRRKLDDLERELALQRENEELIKAQMQTHFESIQRIADTITLPHSMHYLSSRIAEELDLSHLTERLMKGKGQPNTLTPSEKLELWDRLKILSFTRMVLSLWTMTMLSLYIRVQVNILGRHLYIDTARGGSSHLLEEADPIDRHDQQKFLASADFLSNYSIPALISNMHAAAAEVLKGKQLRDFISSTVLHGTIMQILDLFVSTGKPHNLVDYLIPGDGKFYEPASTSNRADSSTPADVTKFDQLMAEIRTVLSSAEFRNVMDISLRTVVDAMVEDIMGDGSLSSKMVLAKLLPRVAQTGPLLLEEPSKNRFIQTIHKAPEVEFFFTLLYANMPIS